MLEIPKVLSQGNRQQDSLVVTSAVHGHQLHRPEVSPEVRQTDLPFNPSFAPEQFVWPWTSDLTLKHSFLICKMGIMIVVCPHRLLQVIVRSNGIH